MERDLIVGTKQKGALLTIVDRKTRITFAVKINNKLAGLPYRGMHIMRHGGCRNIYNRTGDFSVAQQHLGNKSYKTTLVYAQREAKALTKVAQEMWNSHERGRNWSQSDFEHKKT